MVMGSLVLVAGESWGRVGIYFCVALGCLDTGNERVRIIGADLRQRLAPITFRLVT